MKKIDSFIHLNQTEAYQSGLHQEGKNEAQADSEQIKVFLPVDRPLVQQHENDRNEGRIQSHAARQYRYDFVGIVPQTAGNSQRVDILEPHVDIKAEEPDKQRSFAVQQNEQRGQRQQQHGQQKPKLPRAHMGIGLPIIKRQFGHGFVRFVDLLKLFALFRCHRSRHPLQAYIGFPGYVIHQR